MKNHYGAYGIVRVRVHHGARRGQPKFPRRGSRSVCSSQVKPKGGASSALLNPFEETRNGELLWSAELILPQRQDRHERVPSVCRSHRHNRRKDSGCGNNDEILRLLWPAHERN